MDYDLCLAWNWEHDAGFVALLEEAAREAGCALLQVTPQNLEPVLESLRRGLDSFRVLLDRASDADERFLPLVAWAARPLPTVLLLVAVAAGLVPSGLAVAVPLVAWLTGLCFGAMALAVTARAPSYAFFDYYFTLGIGVMFFCSGVFFPLASLPGWAQVLAWCLPLTHAAALCRSLVRGAPTLMALVHVAWLGAVTVGSLLLAERLVRRRLIV